AHPPHRRVRFLLHARGHAAHRGEDPGRRNGGDEGARPLPDEREPGAVPPLPPAGARQDTKQGSNAMIEVKTLGFVGLGVMGEPMCANLVRKSGLPVYGSDLKRAPLERLAALGLEPCASVAEVAAQADLVFLSLPSGVEVEK